MFDKEVSFPDRRLITSSCRLPVVLLVLEFVFVNMGSGIPQFFHSAVDLRIHDLQAGGIQFFDQTEDC
jgi:hypothetical protein